MLFTPCSAGSAAHNNPYQRQLCKVQPYMNWNTWNIGRFPSAFQSKPNYPNAWYFLHRKEQFSSLQLSAAPPTPCLSSVPQVWTKVICAGPSKVVEMPSHSGTVLLWTVNYVWGKSRLNDNRRSNPWSTKHLFWHRNARHKNKERNKDSSENVVRTDHMCIW